MALSNPRREGARALALPIALLAGMALLLSLTFHRRPAPPRSGAPQQDVAALGRELDRLVGALHRREMAKGCVAQAVSRGEMPLLEAAARWLALTREAPFDWEKYRALRRGGSDEERVCRSLIDLAAELRGEEDPCAGAALRAALERELEGHLRRGPLRLPELDAAREER